jgi:hypothetical protein
VTGDFEALRATMASAMENSYDALGNTSSDPTPGDLPTLLSSNAHIKRQSGQSKLSHRKDLFVKNSHTSVGGISSEPLVTLKGSVSGPAEAIALDSTSANSAAEMKGFIDGDHVEYYSKSYGEWIPGVISDVRPNGCLQLLHDDGSLLKNNADSNSVRLAKEQAKQGHDNQPQLDTILEDCTLAMCSIAASAQVKIHQGLSEGMAYDQQLEFSHLKFCHSLNTAMGPDMAGLMMVVMMMAVALILTLIMMTSMAAAMVMKVMVAAVVVTVMLELVVMVLMPKKFII